MNDELLLPIVRDSLQTHHIVHSALDCDDKFADTAAFCEHYGFRPEQAANTILVADKKNVQNIVACVLLADSRLDVNKKVCALMGTKRASFATAEQTREVSGMEIGGVTIFGLPETMPIYIDSRVMGQAEVILGGGNRTSKIKLAPQELTKLPSVTIVDHLALASS